MNANEYAAFLEARTKAEIQQVRAMLDALGAYLNCLEAGEPDCGRQWNRVIDAAESLIGAAQVQGFRNTDADAAEATA